MLTQVRDSVGHPEEWYRVCWDPTGLHLPCAWQVPNALSVHVGGKVMQFLYALPGLSFHPNQILLEGLALGADSPGALIIRVPRLTTRKKNVGISTHRGRPFLAQRPILNLI